jgi:glucose 1-dehydrogenase
MRAVTVVAGRSRSARMDDVDGPVGEGALLVEAVAPGVCGTGPEIVAGEYGRPPPGRARLVLGHESLGRVLEAPDGGRFAPGVLVAGIVRRPDPEFAPAERPPAAIRAAAARCARRGSAAGWPHGRPRGPG